MDLGNFVLFSMLVIVVNEKIVKYVYNGWP